MEGLCRRNRIKRLLENAIESVQILGDDNFIEKKNMRKIATDYSKKMFEALCADIVLYFS